MSPMIWGYLAGVVVTVILMGLSSVLDKTSEDVDPPTKTLIVAVVSILWPCSLTLLTGYGLWCLGVGIGRGISTRDRRGEEAEIELQRQRAAKMGWRIGVKHDGSD